MPGYSPDRALEYAAHARSQIVPYGWLLDAIAEAEPAGKRVLDLGCGNGIYATRLVREFGAADVVGVDASPTMAHLAQAHAVERDTRGRVHAAVGDAMDLPLRTGSFDLVLIVNLLHGVQEVRRVLAESARVLVPRGQLAVSMYTVEPEKEYEPHYGALLPPQLRNFRRGTTLASDAILRHDSHYWEALRETGFNVERWTGNPSSSTFIDPSYPFADRMVLKETIVRASRR